MADKKKKDETSRGGSGFMGQVAGIGLDLKDHPQEEKGVYERPAAKPTAKPKKPVKPKRVTGKQDLVLQMISPDLVTPWAYANRPDNEFGDMDELISSIAKSQEVPCLVRPIAKGKFELIYGRRRWRAAQELGIDLLCQVRNIDDQAAFVAQATENEQRKDLSAWARAKDYDQALKNKVFKTVGALAASLGLDRTSVQSVLVFNRIPKEITDAIDDMRLVGINTAKTIVRLIGEDAKHTETIIANAEGIREGKVSGKNLERLCLMPEATGQVTRMISGRAGDLFSMSVTSRGALNINILKNARNFLTEDEIAEILKEAFDRKMSELE